MKKLLFIIFLMVFSFAITGNAKKPKVVWPKAVLTLKDGTVLNGYLQNDIHFMKKNIYFSETQNGKDVKYKIVDIKSLEVDNALQDGKKRIFILIDDDPCKNSLGRRAVAHNARDKERHSGQRRARHDDI